MGFFSKKDKNVETEANVGSQTTGTVDDLSKVLDESVWESVFEDLKGNKQFITTRGGSTKYVVFLIETAQFGGLAGRDAKKDESKGSIIEAIKTGRIKTYLPMDMLKSGLIVIIPDSNTIENMDEFNVFYNIDYVLSTIDSDGITETVTGADGKEITYKFGVIRDIVREKGNIDDLFSGDVGVKFDEGSSADDIEPDPSEAPADVSFADAVQNSGDDIEPDPDEDRTVSPAPTEQTDEPIGEDISDLNIDTDTSEDFSDIDNNIPNESASAGGSSGNGSELFEESQDDAYLDGDTGGYDEYEDVTSDVVNDFVTRKFFSNDLGLEVSTQAFDAQFMHKNEYIPFNENRGPGWINEYLSNFSKDANTRMERMHTENLFRMRESFMRLIQGHCANIAKILDITNDKTQYGKINAAIRRAHDDNLDNIDKAIEDKQAQLEIAWQEQLESVAQAEALKAKENYKKEYGDKHQRDIMKLRDIEKEEIENDYQASLRAMNEDRRAEATKLLDLAINETLDKMSDAYVDILEAERAEYDKYHEQMLKFIDDNRKDEKARIEALAEENRQVKRANEVRGEYIAKIKAMSAEFEMKRTVLQSDLDNMRREHEIEIKNHDNELTSRVAAERSRADSLQVQLDTLLQQYSELEDKKNKELEERVKTYKDDAALKDTQMQHIIQSNKKSNMLTIGLCVALLVAGLGIGFLFGNSNANNNAGSAPTPAAPTSMSLSAEVDAEVVESDAAAEFAV